MTRRSAAGVLVALGLGAAVPGVVTPAAAAYEEVAVRDGGTLTGVVRFVRTPPALEPLAVSRHREVCGDLKPSESLVVGRDGGVRGSVILIEGVTRGKKVEPDVVIDNARCLVVPHVAATMVGARARVKNSDAVLHNTRGFLGTSTVFNVALPNRAQAVDITRRLAKPGVVRIVCDAHRHMSGWLVVHDSPYFATTDERGAYRIHGIPPATWKVRMWHEGFRRKGTDKDGRPVYGDPVTVARTVTVAPKTSTTVDFELR